MKLRIQHEDGTTEVLTLRGDWTVVEGVELDRLRSASGFEHFFTKAGFYDGWGSGLGESSPQADHILSALETKRRVVSRSRVT
jgi:hypothetical protein